MKPSFTLTFFARLFDATSRHGLSLNDLSVLGSIAIIAEGQRAAGKPAEALFSDIVGVLNLSDSPIAASLRHLRDQGLIEVRADRYNKFFYRLADGVLKTKGATA